jgi:hypothetical protein
MNNNLIVGLVILLVIVLVLGSMRMNENFQNNSGACPLGNVHPDNHLRDFVNDSRNNSNNSSNNNNNSNNKLDRVLSLLGAGSGEQPEIDTDDYVRKTNIERSARSVARQYCPVPPDYDPSQYIKKTEIDTEIRCPKMPDLKDYVLKSTIPPATKCPPCICPKVNVKAGFCKKCPEPEPAVCPPPAPCSANQCKDVIKCPEPAPIPVSEPLKCPPPQACPKPRPCPDVERCPANQCPKCKYYGVKTIDTAKPIDQMINDLLNGNDPEKEKKLKQLRDLLGIVPPTEAARVVTTASTPTQAPTQPMTTSPPTVRASNSRTESTAAPTTQSYMEPVADYDNRCVDESLMYSAVGVLGSSFI